MLIVIMFDTAMKQDRQVVLGGFEGGGGLNCERCSHTAFTDNADCHHV